MTKGRVILKALIAKRKLREICELNDISYKFCHAVSEGNKNPSYDMMKKIRFMIPTDFWFDEATSQFIEKVRNTIKDE